MFYHYLLVINSISQLKTKLLVDFNNINILGLMLVFFDVFSGPVMSLDVMDAMRSSQNHK